MSIFYQYRQESCHFFTSINNTFPAHLHRQIELMVVLEGSLTVTADHKEYIMSAGDGMILFPNQVHSLCTPESSKIFLCIFEESFCHSYQKFFSNSRPVSPLFHLPGLPEHSRVAVEGLLGLLEHWEEDTPMPDSVLYFSQGYLTLLLASIFQNLELEETHGINDLELEQRILLYIDSHFTQSLSLEILSQEFGFSRYSISRMFSEKLNTSFPDYVNSKRLECARSMLTNTNLHVSRIAEASGFGSTRTFFREFRDYYGITPGDFRRNHGFPKA